jgi:hypothetical protein
MKRMTRLAKKRLLQVEKKDGVRNHCPHNSKSSALDREYSRMAADAEMIMRGYIALARLQQAQRDSKSIRESQGPRSSVEKGEHPSSH